MHITHLVKTTWSRFIMAACGFFLLTVLGAGCAGSSQPEPYFSVIPNFQQVHGHHWPVGEILTLTIDDPSTTPAPDFSSTATVVEAPWDPGTDSWVEFNLYELYEHPTELVKPGNIFNLSGSNFSKTLVVQPLFVTLVDPAHQLIAGTAEPGSSVRVDPNPGEPDTSVTVTVDEEGTWQASNPAWDLLPTFGGDATQWDEDRDSTQIQLRLPTLTASLDHHFIQLIDFSYNTEVTLILKTLGLSKTITTDKEGNAWIEAWEWGTPEDIQLQPGDTIEAIDHFAGFTKTLTLEPINLSEINTELNLVMGTAPAGRVVAVDAGSDSASASLEVTADADGSWQADFTGAFDLEPGMFFSARLPDEDYDSTQAEFEIHNP